MLITQRSLQGFWLKVLVLALFGYAVLGRGFSYFFVGEFILVLGFFIFLESQRVMLLFSDSVLLLWAIFAFWGFCRTVPFVSTYHFDAVRDAVLWGYGTFALLITAFINRSNQISRALNSYRRFLRWYLPVLPLLTLVSFAYKNMPTIPWSNHVGIISLKRDDAAVHLAGAALFLLLFPNRRSASEKQGMSIYRLAGFVGWSLTAVIVLVMNRSGFLAILVPLIVASIVKTRTVGWKVALFGITSILLTLVVLEANLIPAQVSTKQFTSKQIASNLGSIVGAGNSDVYLEGTKEWRLIWWKKIINYTIYGPYFWTGKGFGVNLAQDDGPPGLTKEETSLRSPHNGSMTVLARMGVPGIIIWVALNLTFVLRLFKAYRLATQSGSQFWSRLTLWIFCYWLAAIISMSFDVYHEGPQGGIWFWSIVGFGISAMRVQAYETQLSIAQSGMRIIDATNSEYSPVHA